MLRVTCREKDSKVIVKVEGRLVGPWVEELKRAVLEIGAIPLSLEIDIGGLTFADESGEKALLWLFKMGAHFRGNEPCCNYLCERLAIPREAADRAFELPGRRPK